MKGEPLLCIGCERGTSEKFSKIRLETRYRTKKPREFHEVLVSMRVGAYPKEASTTLEKAFGSRTAISANILRFKTTLCSRIPAIKRL